MTMLDAKDVETPELDKMQSLNTPRPPFDVLSQFANWLESEGFMLCRYGAPKTRRVRCDRCKGRRIDHEALTARQRQLLHRGALPDEEWPPCPRCAGEGYTEQDYVDEDSLQPIQKGWSRIFAEFWQLDQDAIDREKMELLQAIQKPATTMKRCRTCQRKMDSGTAWCCETCEMLQDDVDPLVKAAIPVLAKVMSHSPTHSEFRPFRTDHWIGFDVNVDPGQGLRGGWWHFGIWLRTGDLYAGEAEASLLSMGDDPVDPDEAWLLTPTTPSKKDRGPKGTDREAVS